MAVGFLTADRQTVSSQALITAGRELCAAVDGLRFSPPVTHVLNPLDYAWAPHEQYLRRFGEGRKQVVFLGMNPGPFGMVQVGVPFGESTRCVTGCGSTHRSANQRRPIRHARWKVLPVSAPRCQASVCGALFAERYPRADDFCRSLRAELLPAGVLRQGAQRDTGQTAERRNGAALRFACDAHLRACVDALAPQWLIGIGKFAENQARLAIGQSSPEVRIGTILHPSPASPSPTVAGAAGRSAAGGTGHLVDAGGAPPLRVTSGSFPHEAHHRVK